MDDNLVSWNLPNFVSFAFMILILWVVIGGAGHLLFRRGKGGKQSLSPSSVGNTAFQE